MMLRRTFLAGAGAFLRGEPRAATAHPLATEAAERALSEGANALEAAISAAAVLSVVEPYASGLGGGGVFIVWRNDGSRLAIDCRPSAPRSARAAMFTGMEQEEIESSPLSIGVPGSVRGWNAMHGVSREHFAGARTWEQLLAPAIGLARDGFAVSETFAATLARNEARLTTDAREIFGGAQQGTWLRQPAQAATLESLAAGGAEAFYTGDIAESVVAATGGRITGADLATYDVRWLAPLEGSYRGRAILSAPPPASGYVLIAMLNLAEGFPLGQDDFRWMSTNETHTRIEIQKLAYADKAGYLGDPEFIRVPVTGLISREYAAERRALIALDRSLPEGTARGNPAPYSTTHLSILDADGNAVSFTTTLSDLFGAGRTASGFLLNNTLSNFDADGRGNNAPAAGKRPSTAIAPFLVIENGAVRIAGGAAGGNRIPGILFAVVSAMLDHGLSAQDAVAAPRIVNENRTTGVGLSNTRLEPAPYAPPLELVTALRARGQTILRNTLPFGAVQLVTSVDRGLDPRRGGEF
jgi:gamma-glutamyltranspeptidase/glutathione hydrolase